MTISVKQVRIGDVLSINTGYNPLDDENCRVLKIRDSKGLFGDEMISFFIESRYGNHWYDCLVYGKYGNNPRFEYKLTKVEF